MRKVKEKNLEGGPLECGTPFMAGLYVPGRLPTSWLKVRWNKEVRETLGGYSTAASPGFPAPKPDACLGNRTRI